MHLTCVGSHDSSLTPLGTAKVTLFEWQAHGVYLNDLPDPAVLSTISSHKDEHFLVLCPLNRPNDVVDSFAQNFQFNVVNL